VHAREELVRDFTAGDRYRVGEFEDESFDAVEKGRGFPVEKRE
jgi:hypothetical protein